MDRRRLRAGGSGLHRNLASQNSKTQSQLLSRQDSSSLQAKSISENTLTRKRKSIFDSSRDSDDDLGLPLAESTTVKRRRDDSKSCEDSRENINISIGPKSIDGTPRKTLSTTQRLLNASKTPDRNNPKSNSSSRGVRVERSQKVSEPAKKCKFSEFLQEAGITLNTDGPHILHTDLVKVQCKMKKLLDSGRYKKEEVVKLLEKYIEKEGSLQNALTEMEIPINSEVSNVLNSSSLIKTLLQVPELYPEIYTSLLSKLNESVILADSAESVPWARLFLQQFRFLDVVINTDILSNNLEQILESCPIWFQSELIAVLPDLVTDKQHQIIAEMLNKIMEENPDLTRVILDCMSSLNLGQGYLNEHREKVINLLKTNVKMDDIPAIINFVLEDCTDSENFKKTIMILRHTDIQPLAGENVEDCSRNQSEIINSVKMAMLASKNIANTTIAIIKEINKDPKPLDVILLLLVYHTTPTKKKTIESIFKQYVRSGFYRPSLLSLLYNDYKKVVQELQSSAIRISSNLLKMNERVYVDFAIEWFRLQLSAHKEVIFKQREILEKIIFLMGNNNQTAKNALSLLCRMIGKEEERKCLQTHSHHLSILLDKMENLELEEIGTLNDLLHSVYKNSSTTMPALRDDLFIMIQKQLGISKPLIKCKGVMGAVMAMKHLMQSSETRKEAEKLFKTVHANVKSCPRSKALFYDQLSRIISETEDISDEFVQYLMNFIEDEFINTYMIERSTYRGELVPKYGLNNEEDEPQNCVLSFEGRKYGAVVPISFKLLKACCFRLSKDGELDAIDALLGCAILMPENLDVADDFVVDLVICCINWFREIISAFVMQTDALLRKQVLQRLDSLMHLQGELCTLICLCGPRYQPTPCYFHRFPAPPFTRTEKRIPKKGKKGKKDSEKSVTLTETESWEMGCILCSKNPTYFRKLDAKIAYLLETRMNLCATQSTQYSITLNQVCFIAKELLALFDQDSKEVLVKDLIGLLPQILSKLQDIVEFLREEKNVQCGEAACTLLCLLSKIFNWKGFESVTYNALLREGLRALASRVDVANEMLRSCKELVAESYKYFESLSDIATQISTAFALVTMCQSLMKHSETFTKQHKDKHAKMAYGFLCLQWPEDKQLSSQYKTAVNGLLNNWMDNEPHPLDTVTHILEWLPDETENLKKQTDYLNRMPTVGRSNFHSLYKKMFDGLIKGVKISLSLAKSDPDRIEIWIQVATNVRSLVKISGTLKTKNNLSIFLKNLPILLRYFVSFGMPILEHNLKYQMDDVTRILKLMQAGTRHLHAICCDTAEKKDVTLTKFVPAAKAVLEKLLYSVKGMLVLNNSPSAFWMGNLINKNLEGREIRSQATSTESSLQHTDTGSDDITNASSEVLDSDIDNESVEENNDEDSS